MSYEDYRLASYRAGTRAPISMTPQDMAVRQVPGRLRAPAEGFFDFFMRFGVRIPVILERQKEEVRAAIRAEFDSDALAFLAGDEIRVPMPSIVVSGRKPRPAP